MMFTAQEISEATGFPTYEQMKEWCDANAEGRLIVLPDLNNPGFTVENGSAVITVFVLKKPVAPDCDTCRHSPPSSFDGKPCCACDPSSVYTNCYDPKEAGDIPEGQL